MGQQRKTCRERRFENAGPETEGEMPQAKERQQSSEAGRGEEQTPDFRRAAALGWHRDFSRKLVLDIWPSELWENNYAVSFEDTTFLVICCSSHRKVIQMAQTREVVRSDQIMHTEEAKRICQWSECQVGREDDSKALTWLTRRNVTTSLSFIQRRFLSIYHRPCQSLCCMPGTEPWRDSNEVLRRETYSNHTPAIGHLCYKRKSPGAMKPDKN